MKTSQYSKTVSQILILLQGDPALFTEDSMIWSLNKTNKLDTE